MALWEDIKQGKCLASVENRKRRYFLQIILGGMVLKTTEKPDSVQHGGGQMLAINTFPSGNVSIQNFGSTYREISWSSWFEGVDAMERMYQIGNMRQKGEAIDFVTEAYTQKVVIQEFQPEHRTNFFIPFTITLQRVVQITKQIPNEAVDKIAEAIKTEAEQKQEQNTESQNYTIKAGDTLSKIAKNHYGNANEWDRIYQANKDKLTSPHKIQIGQELILP